MAYIPRNTPDQFANFLLHAANACPRTCYCWVKEVEMECVLGDIPEKHQVEGWFLTFCELLDESPHYVVPQNVHEACSTLCMFSSPSQVVWHRMEEVLSVH